MKSRQQITRTDIFNSPVDQTSKYLEV